MSDYYDGPYMKRLNRFGNDYQSRVLGQRKKVFQDLLLKSLYRVDFEYNNNIYPGILEKYKQDETETLHYLLTELEVELPTGTILSIPDGLGHETRWMIYWLENIQTSGYNRYIVLKMTHKLNWVGRDKNWHTAYGYFYGQEDNMLKDELRSRSRNHALYTEALKMSFFITPFNEDFRKDDYFEVTTATENNELTEAYVVVGYDIISTPGVEYITVDPVYLRDHTKPPEHTPGIEDDQFFWLEGGQYDS